METQIRSRQDSQQSNKGMSQNGSGSQSIGESGQYHQQYNDQQIDPNQAEQYMSQIGAELYEDMEGVTNSELRERPMTSSQQTAKRLMNNMGNESQMDQNSQQMESDTEYKSRQQNYSNQQKQIHKLNHKNLYNQDDQKSQSQISLTNDNNSRQDENQYTEDEGRQKVGGLTGTQNMIRGMKSQNFFQMSGIPKFGKNWLDNFIPDEEMQNTFMTSEVVRNVLMLQCIFYASVFNDLVLYKHTFINSRQMKEGDENASINELQQKNQMTEFNVGIIGCGQVGTVLLTKLLEVREQYHNLKLIVSTRQPHLLRPFQKEFGIEVVFDNQKVAAKSDIIFLCVLPSQAQEVLKDIREVIKERIDASKKNKFLINPIVVSTCAATGYKKLGLMLSDEAIFLRTNIDVPIIKEYLLRSQNLARLNHANKNDDIKSSNSKISGAKKDLIQLAEEKLGSESSSKKGTANMQYRKKLKSRDSHAVDSQKPQSRGAQGSRQFDRVLSSRAIQIGNENGITAEFITKQTAEQTVLKLNDLFTMFDVFQSSLYANDPEVQDSIHDKQSESQKFSYEESILVTILGENYLDFINQETGEWEQDDRVIQTFQELFEDRIRYLFDAENDE